MQLTGKESLATRPNVIRQISEASSDRHAELPFDPEIARLLDF
jgi:hypothetical protein